MDRVMNRVLKTDPFLADKFHAEKPLYAALVPDEIFKGSHFERRFVTPFGSVWEDLAVTAANYGLGSGLKGHSIFGKVKEGDTLAHIFKVTNKGEEPLFIFNAVKSCDCLFAKYQQGMIKPGETTDVHVYFATKGRKGPQVRTVTITCNTDPADIPLTINADVQ